MAQCLCFGGLLRGRGDDDDDKDAAARRPRQTVPPRASRLNLRRRLRASATQEENKSKIFSFQELAGATNNFSDETVIGRGGFGPVYRGRLESGDVVAIKRLDNRGFQGNKEFLVEVLMLSLLRHPNLVQLIGYCAEGDQRLLVYEYFPLGALEDHIHDLLPRQQPLDWNTRMIIAAEAARGLNYLHNEARPCVIYRDLKTANILLDDGFHTKLSDFGFAKFGPAEGQSHVSTRVMGTHGYCAPEYAMTGRLTTKSDIYCFGVVLLELITGRKALDETRGSNEKYLAEWARSLARERRNFPQMADPRLRGHFSVSTLKMAVEVAVMCVREQPANRPDSSELVRALDFISSRKYVPNDPRPRAPTPKGEGSSSTPTQDSQRERDIAEARQWGETNRGKMHQQHPDRQPQQ